MKPARILILATALAAGLGAAWLVAGSKPPPALRLAAPSAPAMPMEDVLVAAKEIQFGSVIQQDDMRWQKWPKASVPPGIISKAAMPHAIADFKGSLTRDPIGAGEPLYAHRLIQPGKASFMAAMLPAGSRAVAINIDAQGATTAGGFILPNDRVDVIHTFKDDDAARAGGDGMVSETILRNVRVLAIGQNVQQQGDQRVVVGSNATLELTPGQVERIVLAQRVGQLSLSLRSMADTSATTTEEDRPPPKPDEMTIVRFGVPVQTRPH
jgi:pilus assembly protein CpaB